MYKFTIKRERVFFENGIMAQNPSGQLESDQTDTLGNGDINLSDLWV